MHFREVTEREDHDAKGIGNRTYTDKKRVRRYFIPECQ